MWREKRVEISFGLTFFCAIVMLFEDIGESMGVEWIETWDDLHVWEFFVLSSLLVAVGFLAVEFRKSMRLRVSLEEKIKAASGSFNRLLEAHYERWGFSEAERDVARLILKGCSNAEIAEIRGAAEGTVKAQTHAIYKKSGYSGKTQFLSALLEELTEGSSVA